jgi:N-methylhydantoinase B
LALGGETRETQAVEIDRSLSEGCELTIVAAAGGGWGDPRDREPDAVRADVLDGYVSPEAAAAVYGVSLGNGGSSDVPAAVAVDANEGGAT